MMKRLFGILCPLFAILLMAGCGNKEASKKTSQDESSSSSAKSASEGNQKDASTDGLVSPKNLTDVKVDGGVVVGQLAPTLRAKDTEGRLFSLADYRGKVVLLDFWGNW